MFSGYTNINSPPTVIQEEALYSLLRPDYSFDAVGVFDTTGGGKSAITQVAGALLGGITLFLQPTLTLQGDQCLRQMQRLNTVVYNLNIVAKSKSTASRVFQQLEGYLLLPKEERQRISIYISPQKLGASKTWQDFFEKAARLGVLRMVVVDECHLFSNDRILFRKDFALLKEALFDKIRPFAPVRKLFLSATVQEATLLELEKFYGVRIDKRVWASAKRMYKGHVKIEWAFRGRQVFTADLKSQIVKVLSSDPTAKVIGYTEAEKRVAPLVEHAYNAYETLNAKTKETNDFLVNEIVGPRSVENKTIEIGLFSERIQHPLSKRCRVLLSTAPAGNHGIDYFNVPFVGREGFPTCPFSKFQELGRLLRISLGLVGDHPTPTYRVVADVSGYHYLLKRAYQNETTEGKKLALKHLDQVVQLFLGNECIHFALASMFGNPNEPYDLPSSCGSNCFICDGSYRHDVIVPYDKEALRDFLFDLNSNSVRLYPDFADRLWKNKERCKKVFQDRGVFKYQVDALVFHLAVFGVVDMKYREDEDKKDGDIYVLVKRDVFTDRDGDSRRWERFEKHRA